jgi:hypothetical protein
MKTWIRNFFGIPEGFEGRLRRLERESEYHTIQQAKIVNAIAAIGSGLGRIIAKFDPLYAQDELDPERRKASDEIGDKVMAKLTAEHIERSKYDPKEP